MHQDPCRADEEGVVLGDGERVDRRSAHAAPHAQYRHVRPRRRAQPVAQHEVARRDPACPRRHEPTVEPEGVISRHRDRAAIAQVHREQRRDRVGDDRLHRLSLDFARRGVFGEHRIANAQRVYRVQPVRRGDECPRREAQGARFRRPLDRASGPAFGQLLDDPDRRVVLHLLDDAAAAQLERRLGRQLGRFDAFAPDGHEDEQVAREVHYRQELVHAALVPVLQRLDVVARHQVVGPVRQRADRAPFATTMPPKSNYSQPNRLNLPPLFNTLDSFNSSVFDFISNNGLPSVVSSHRFQYG